MKHLKLVPKYYFTREEKEAMSREIKQLSKLVTKDNKDLIAPRVADLKYKLNYKKKAVLYRNHKIESTDKDFLTVKDLMSIKKKYNDSIREERKNRKVKAIEHKNVNGFEYDVCGGIITTPLKDIKRKHHPKFTKVYKRPYCKSNFIGIEMEMISDISQDQMAMLITLYKLSHKIRIMSDASIKTDSECPYGFELNIMDTEYNIHNTLDQLSKLLSNADFKFKVNTSCGTHVHLDMRNRNAKECYAKLYDNLDLIIGSTKKSRAENDYCKRNIERDMNLAQHTYASGRGSRYQAINPTSIDKHGTLEVRVFEGTTDIYKVKSWVDLLFSIVNSQTKAVVNV